MQGSHHAEPVGETQDEEQAEGNSNITGASNIVRYDVETGKRPSSQSSSRASSAVVASLQTLHEGAAKQHTNGWVGETPAAQGPKVTDSQAAAATTISTVPPPVSAQGFFIKTRLGRFHSLQRSTVNDTQFTHVNAIRALLGLQ
jgi:hypothetical protein